MLERARRELAEAWADPPQRWALGFAGVAAAVTVLLLAWRAAGW